MKTILSLGVGTQSTMIALACTQQYRIDEIYNKYPEGIICIFADTGSEKKETYQYWNDTLEPILKRNEIEYYVVQSKHGKLYDYYLENKIIPTRQFRHCTDKFKIIPIKNKTKELFPNVSYKNPVSQIIGYTVDEIQRLSPNKVKFIINEFPLVDLGYSRDDVIKQFDRWGLPCPVKSGCWLCPFMRKKEILELNNKQFDDLIILESNTKLYLYQDKPVKYWRRQKHIKDANLKLDDFFDMDECTGHCFT